MRLIETESQSLRMTAWILEMGQQEQYNDNPVSKLIRFVALLWAALAIVFAFTDLRISAAFADPHSRWGNFLAEWGMYPGY